MDCSWLDVGDLVEIATADTTLRGEVLRITEEALLVRTAKGLKSQVAVAAIVRLEQVESLDAPAPAVATPAPAAAAEGSVAAACRQALTAAEALAIPAALPYTDCVALKQRNAIYNSIHHAATKDKSSLDEKVTTAIRKLRLEYEDTRDDELPALIAYLHTLYTKGEHFADAVTFLQQHGSPAALREFFLTYGTLAERLPFWALFRREPAVLLRAFVVSYRNTLEVNALMADFVHGMYTDTQLSAEDKNVVLYALAERLYDPATLPSQEAADSTALTDHLYRRLIAVLGEPAPAPVAEAPSPSTEPPKKAVVEKTTFVAEKPSGDASYSQRFTARLHKAKTYEQCQQMEQALTTYIREGNGNTLSAFNDLMMLCLRNTYGKYETVLRMYEEYKDDPAFASAEEQNKLKHFAATAYEMKAAQGRTEEATSAREKALALWAELAKVFTQEESAKYSDAFVRAAQLLSALGRYEEALDYCRMAQEHIVSVERSRGIELGYPQKSQALYLLPIAIYSQMAAKAHRDDDDEKAAQRYVADAEALLEKFSARYGSVVSQRVQKVREMLDKASRAEEDIDSLISDSPLEELKSPWLTDRLRRCQYRRLAKLLEKEEGTLAVSGDEERGYSWNVSSAGMAEEYYKRLKNVTGFIFDNDGYVSANNRQEMANNQLEMTKICEFLTECYSTRNTEEGPAEYEQEFTKWKGNFIQHAATYMWLLSYGADDKDTRAYYLSEALQLFFRTATEPLQAEYMDAFNSLLLMHVETDPQAYCLSFAGAKRLKGNARKMVFSMIAQTLERAYQDHPQQTIDTIYRLARMGYRTGSWATQELSELVFRLGDTARNGVVEAVCRLAATVDATIEFSAAERPFRDALTCCAEAMTRRRDTVVIALQKLESLLRREEVTEYYDFRDRLDKELGEISLNGYTETDKQRWLALRDQLQRYIVVVSDKAQVADEKRAILQTIETAMMAVDVAYADRPTELSPRLQSVCHALQEQCAIRRRLMEEELGPCVEVTEFHGEEGYYPDPNNGRVLLMLRLTNGPDRLAATDVRLQVTGGQEGVWYSRDEEWKDVCPSLAGGKSAYCHEVCLQLSDRHAADMYLTVPVRVSYHSCYQVLPIEKTVELTVYLQPVGRWQRIENPYSETAIDPAQSEDLGSNAKTFKGREEDISQLSDRLAFSQGGKTIILYGQYRSGKTSLGNYVVDRVRRLNPDVVIANAGELSSHARPADVVEKIREQILWSLEDACDVEWEAIAPTFGEVPFTDDNYEEVFTGFARELRRAVKELGKSVVVQVDEIGRLFTAVEVAEEFMGMWKNVMNLRAFNAIFIGHDVITQIIRQAPNVFATAENRQVSYLSKADIGELVHDPTRDVNGDSHFCEDVVEYIWDMTDGNGFYAQSLCRAAVDYMNAHHIRKLNAAYVKETVKSWLGRTADAVAVYGHPMYDSGEVGQVAVSPREAQMLLDAVIRAKSYEGALAYAADTYGVQREDGVRILDSLKDRGVVVADKQDGGLRVRCRLYSEHLNPLVVETLLRRDLREQ